MAVPMGKPATSFNAQNRKWVKDMLDGGGGSGGSGLPDITEADEGKVLTVDDGEATWANSNVMVVWSVADESGYVFTLDKTWQEIVDALVDGIFPVVFYKYPGDLDQVTINYVQNVGQTENDYFVSFIGDYSYRCSAPNEYPSMED